MPAAISSACRAIVRATLPHYSSRCKKRPGFTLFTATWAARAWGISAWAASPGRWRTERTALNSIYKLDRMQRSTSFRWCNFPMATRFVHSKRSSVGWLSKSVPASRWSVEGDGGFGAGLHLIAGDLGGEFAAVEVVAFAVEDAQFGDDGLHAGAGGGGEAEFDF